jgi:hypothetical protein
VVVITRKRLALLAACVLVSACTSAAPAKTKKKKKKKKKTDDVELVDDDRPRKKKKQKAKKRVAEAEVDDDEVRLDDEDEEDDAPRRPKKAARKRAAEPEPDEPDEPEPERPTPAKPAPAPKKAPPRKPPPKKAPPRKPPPKVAAKTPAKRERPASDEPPEIDMSEIDMTSEDDPSSGERRVAAIPVPGVDDTPEAVEPIDVAPDEAAAIAGPTLDRRPLVLGKGKSEVHGGLRVSVLTLPGAEPDTQVSTTSQGLTLGGSYGVSDDLEVGADYAFSVSPGQLKGPFTLRGAYQVHRSDKLDVAVAAGLGVDFYETTTSTMTTISTTYVSLQLGAWARYHVTPKASIFTGLPALPPSSVSLTKLALPLPPFTYQLALGLNNAGTVALELPVGFGLQATPKLYAFASLNFAHLRIANTQTAILFADFIPLTLGAFYTLNKLDLGVVFSDDLRQGTDYLRLDTVVRYSL